MSRRSVADGISDKRRSVNCAPCRRALPAGFAFPVRRARFGERSEIAVHDHATGRTEHVALTPPTSGHGGGDHGLMEAFVRNVRGEAPPLTTARACLESHLMAFAAEEARMRGTIVDLDALRASMTEPV